MSSWLTALVLSVAILGGGPAALADTELGHTGETGRHRLADVFDSPGAVCDIVLPAFDSLGETWLRVNPPVMFARDRTPGVDRQFVGWRAIISALDDETGDWHVVRRGSTARELASDELASYFQGEGWLTRFPLSRATYSVTVEMLWYDPFDAHRVEGMATHAIEHFLTLMRFRGEQIQGRTANVCRGPR
jgi:hypothetical protein